MSRKLEERSQRLKRKTARVFFSSPFGGLEEEREELTKKHWPRLESMCNKAGYDFIPVDLRWGITSEMSSSAVTIKVCLSEMDRSDMIVGFFGQRYGWHGDNELLQKSFDVAAESYPWVNDYRDKSVTELEYLHGHLRNPGARAACFFFRDKAYDDMKLEKAKKTGEQREIRKFVASTDGPHAFELLADLKQRIEKTRDKCLAVHMNYPNPKEGARLMFETIEKHFNEVLLARPAVKLTEREKENLQHDVFLASRLGMGGNFVGGQKYLDEINKQFMDPNNKVNRILILGDGGTGKSCILSNWITLHQMKSPQDIVIYHFVGSTSGGTVPEFILSRLVDELNDELQERVVHDSSLAAETNDDIRQLLRKLVGLMHRVKETGAKAFLIIDALNKVDKLGQTMKALYWLPKDLPASVHLIVSTLLSDTANVNELTARQYYKMYTRPLDLQEREEMALTALKKRGKTFSKEQQQRIFKQKQTQNPLYLEILLMELVSFGEFFQLDSYIDSLIQAEDTKGLFLKYLERLEKDYNPEDYKGNLAEEISCCIHVARQGLSEKEIRSILGISNQVWSSIFFAMDDFLIERDGRYSFSFKELGQAIEERYFKDNNKKKEYMCKIADYFEEKLKERSVLYDTIIPFRVYMELPWLLTKLGDKDRLVDCLLKPAIFYSLRSGQNKYDLIGYWNTTGLSGEDIVAKQQKVIDDQMALLYNEAVDQGENPKNATEKVIPFVYNLAQFFQDAGHAKAVQPILERALQLTKPLYRTDDIKNDPAVADKYIDIANTLACLYVDTEQFDKADILHHEVLELKEKFESTFQDGTTSLARTLNGLGVLNFKQFKYQESLSYYQRALDKHREAHSPAEQIADILNNIGSVYHALGQWEDAAERFKEALEIYEEAYFGSLPADVGGTMLNLAMAYRRLDKDEDAKRLYLRALDIRENAYGENHPEVAQTLLSYSAFLLFNETEKAVEYSKRAAIIYEKSLGLDHLNTLNAYENIALAYLVLKKPEEAHPYFKTAGERKDATDRMETSIQKLNAVMADYYLNSGQNEEARQLFSRIVKTSFATDRDFAALDFLDNELPPGKRPKREKEHTVVYGLERFPSSIMLLGRVQEQYASSGNAKDMIQVLKKGGFGVEHYNNAYQAFINSNHKKEGMKLLVAAREKFPDDKIIMYNLASGHSSFKDYSKASAIYKKLLEKDPSDVVTLESYARIMSLTGRIHEGRAFYSKALKLAEESGDQALVDKVPEGMGEDLNIADNIRRPDS